MRWWAVTARLRAVEGWQEAVSRCRHLAALPHVSGSGTQNTLARMLHGLGQALKAQGSASLAEEAFAESRSLRQTVGLPPLDLNEPTL